MSLDCCYEHAGLCPGRGPSGPAPEAMVAFRMKRRDAMEVMFDRVAGLDVGKETVGCVCVSPARGVGGTRRRAHSKRQQGRCG